MLGQKRKTDTWFEEAPPPGTDDPRGVQLHRELYPRLGKLQAKLTETLRRKDEITPEIKAVADRILTSGARNDFLMPRTVTTEPPSDHPEGVKAVLGELAPDFVRREPTPMHPDIQRHGALDAELKAIDEALPVIHVELDRAHREASRLVVDHIRAEYQSEVAGPVLEAVVQLNAALIAHRDFLAEFKNVNLLSLRPMPFQDWLGDPTNRTSILRQILRIAAEFGHFDVADIPSTWRT